MNLVGQGFYFDDIEVGFCFRTVGRTITEADLVGFVNVTWMTEELFTNAAARAGMAIKGRVVPAALVYSFAEGLLTPTMQETGLAFLGATLDVKGPTFVGDTIRLECEVTEMRPTSKPGRGLVRTLNKVVTENGRVVLSYDPLRMMKCRPSAGRPDTAA